MKGKLEPEKKVVTFQRNEIIFAERQSVMLNLRDITAEERNNKKLMGSKML